MTIPENSRSLLKINSNVGHIVCLKLKIKTKFAFVLNELKVHSIKILPAQYLLGRLVCSGYIDVWWQAREKWWKQGLTCVSMLGLNVTSHTLGG